jgi:hypothetical protein
MTAELRADGHYQWTYLNQLDDDDPTSIMEVSLDVTTLVQRLIRERDGLKVELGKAHAALSDLKARRSWDEITMHTDPHTRRSVVLRTFYEMRARTMRLEYDPSYHGGPTAVDHFPREDD